MTFDKRLQIKNVYLFEQGLKLRMNDVTHFLSVNIMSL